MIGPAGTSRTEDNFDFFEWYPRYQSFQRYFQDDAQHSVPIQALSAFLIIHLPFQHQPSLVLTSNPMPASSSSAGLAPPGLPAVSLTPYLRRLVETGMEFPGVLHRFFVDDWGSGVGPLHKQECRNHLFATKSGGWASVKKGYDMLPLETIPSLCPLKGPLEAEIEATERSLSQVGPHAPDILKISCLRTRALEGMRLNFGLLFH